MMSSLDTLFTRLSRLHFSLCSPMTWPPNCFFDSPAYIDSLMCASAAKKVHKLQKASKVPAMPSDHPLIGAGKQEHIQSWPGPRTRCAHAYCTPCGTSCVSFGSTW
ncbi:hypothetical protein FB451DRAFT_1360370 [Mycena latifolia]|nr:hypothetical protein FB451DRAFT_1360370 [Mycena latifolia]